MPSVQVRYIVRDVDAAIEFYTKQLGFHLDVHPAPPFAMLSRGDLRLVLSAPNRSGGGGQSMPDGTAPEPGGWNRFIVEVDDLKSTVDRLRNGGVHFRNDIVTGIGGNQILAEDPSGNPVELFQLRLPEAEVANSAQSPDKIGKEAGIPNPKLGGFQRLTGKWTTVGHHPMVPGTTFHGRTSFAWQDGGAFLVMRSEIDEPEIPSGIAIISSDDASDIMTMLYFDERSVSRRYDVALEGNVVRWSRNSPEISQRLAITVSPDGNTMQAKGELSRNNGPWEGDLELSYTRVR